MTLLYLAALLMSALKALTLWQGKDIAQRDIITLYTAILLVLGIVRITHFDVYFVEQFRTFLELYGWYEGRRPLQVFLITIVFIPVSTILFTDKRSSEPRSKGDMGIALATYGLLLLILIALISFHYIDFILMHKIGQITLFTLLEAGALIMIILFHLPGFRLVFGK